MNGTPGRCRGPLFFFLLVALRATSAAELNPALEAPVKLLQPATRETPEMTTRAGRRPVPPPSTPAAKYPQYQLGSKQRHDSAIHEAANSRLRFLLNLPDALALIEVTITIDGQPFQLPRQRRIEQILKDLVVNPPETAEPNPAANSDANPNQTAEPKVAPAITSSITERLRHTMKLTEKVPSQEEVSWLLCNWFDGPTILQLNDNFQQFRANQRPEIIILDRNRDGTISAEEIASSPQSLQECDLNQDGIVQFTEIAAAANDPRIIEMNGGMGCRLTLLPDRISSAIPVPKAVISKQSNPASTGSRFDTNGNGEFDVDELSALQETVPDLKFSISFDTVNPEKSRLAVASAENEFEQGLQRSAIDSSGIMLLFNRTPVIFSAAQLGTGDQISIGAVNDGYPLLPKLDPNDDGRLTIRELRTVPATLITLDHNQDGALTADEIQSPIRVCIGLGACVHLELAGIRSLRGKDNSVPSAGPEWFVRMDRNKDFDLTRAEFPGTDEQFKALDTDGDQLISAEEATSFEKNAQAADNESVRSESNADSSKPKSDSKEKPASQEEKQP